MDLTVRQRAYTLEMEARGYEPAMAINILCKRLAQSEARETERERRIVDLVAEKDALFDGGNHPDAADGPVG